MFSSVSILVEILSIGFFSQAAATQNMKCFVMGQLCPSGWHEWGESCYNVSESPVAWSDARGKCRELGALLAVPRSLKENDFTVTLIPDDSNAWINCNYSSNATNDNKDVVCKEGEEEISYRNWDKGQPDNYEHCIMISTHFESLKKWHDIGCEKKQYVLCKKPMPFLHL